MRRVDSHMTRAVDCQGPLCANNAQGQRRGSPNPAWAQRSRAVLGWSAGGGVVPARAWWIFARAHGCQAMVRSKCQAWSGFSFAILQTSSTVNVLMVAPSGPWMGPPSTAAPRGRCPEEPSHGQVHHRLRSIGVRCPARVGPQSGLRQRDGGWRGPVKGLTHRRACLVQVIQQRTHVWLRRSAAPMPGGAWP